MTPARGDDLRLDVPRATETQWRYTKALNGLYERGDVLVKSCSSSYSSSSIIRQTGIGEKILVIKIRSIRDQMAKEKIVGMLLFWTFS